ncbi:MAG: DUF6434 domain-containing protein [Desulfuromonadaceae bacterium]|nr:DUF6434 domain-containing protein [Desulfuromonadaceae bacterium]MDD5107873.1 DUF6434 domain-containing protein [Desulfuromonadaceae bacterium]
MNRPSLTRFLSIQDFRSFYWLKVELLSFCRANALATTGSKENLQLRVEVFLRSGVAPTDQPYSKTRKSKNQMPKELLRETVISGGWRCSQALRAFFEQEIGSHFHFNEIMRDFIKHGEGKTLQEAIYAWKADRQGPKVSKEIGMQFEYNRHIREFFQEHHGAALAEAIQAWKANKAKRRG